MHTFSLFPLLWVNLLFPLVADGVDVCCRTFQCELDKCAQEPERLGGIFLRYVRMSFPENSFDSLSGRQNIFLPMFPVCQFVCHMAWLSFAVQKWLNGSRSCLEWTLLGVPGTLCYTGGSDPDTELAKISPVVGLLYMPGIAEGRDFELYTHIEGCGL